MSLFPEHRIQHAHEDFKWAAPTRLAELAEDEELWGHYLRTAVYLESSRLQGSVRPAGQQGGVHPPLGPLHVITAIQPGADPRSDESAVRLQVLRRYLASAKKVSIRAVGSNVEGTYSEEGCAVFGLTDNRARKIGRKFGQVAIFAWRGPNWSLIACAADQQTNMTWQWEPSKSYFEHNR